MEPVPGWPEVRQPRQGVMLRPVHGREAWPAWRCGAGCGRKYALAGQQLFEQGRQARQVFGQERARVEAEAPFFQTAKDYIPGFVKRKNPIVINIGATYRF